MSTALRLSCVRTIVIGPVRRLDVEGRPFCTRTITFKGDGESDTAWVLIDVYSEYETATIDVRDEADPEDAAPRYALVYQAGIANLMHDPHGIRADASAHRAPTPVARHGATCTHVYQGEFYGAERMAAGLLLAGEPVALYSANVAGDVRLADWTPGLDACVFRAQARPPAGVTA